MNQNNYKKELTEKGNLERKTENVEHIHNGNISQYEIVKKLIDGLEQEMVYLKKAVAIDFEVNDEAIQRAEKISKIAFALQSCLDLEKGGDIAEKLTWLYRFVRYTCKRIIDNEDLTYIKPAHLIARDLKESWSGIGSEVGKN